MVDRYTKAVLTVIAAALVWLCLWGPGPPTWGTPAEAQARVMDVNIVRVGGRRVGFGGLPVEVSSAVEVRGARYQPVPVEVRVAR